MTLQNRSRLAAVLLLCLLPAAASAQAYPSKPIRLIVRGLPGSADDIQARLLSTPLSKVLGQPVVIDYRTGAGGLVAWEYVAKLAPDGYTMLFTASGLAAVKTLRSEMTIDPWRDFTWVSQVSTFMIVFTVHPSLPVKSLKDLIALARSKPGQLNYGSTGIGATPHLAAEYFKSMAKIDMNHVPYKGSGPAFVDLMAGRIEVGSTGVGAAIPVIKSAKLRALGVTGAVRAAELPQVPTVAEAALPGYEFMPFYAVVLPGGASRELTTSLSQAIGTAMNTPGFREQFAKAAGSDPASNTPDQMLQLAKKDAALIERIVRTAHVKLD